MRFFPPSVKKIFKVTGIFVILVLFSMCRRQCTYVCDEPDMGFTYNGFQRADLDTVRVRRYFPNSKFNDLISETMLYDVFDNGLGRYDAANDWEFYIPATGQAYRFTEISREGRISMRGDCKTMRGCSNGIFSFRLNGQFFNQSYGEVNK